MVLIANFYTSPKKILEALPYMDKNLILGDVFYVKMVSGYSLDRLAIECDSYVTVGLNPTLSVG
ncbi:MAG: hypothetical protein ACRC62_00150 [Microcoleus sp.]